MFISKLSIDGYRNCCEKSQISFNKGLNILVGENASGKSTIIDALRLILKDQEQSYITEDAKYIYTHIDCDEIGKGAFSQALLEKIESGQTIIVPQYIKEAIIWACGGDCE